MWTLVLAQFLFVAAMAAATCFDVSQRRIPNAFNVCLFATAFLFQAAVHGWAGTLDGLMGAALGLGVLIAPFYAGWLGGGDVKLVMAIGAWLGPAQTGWAVLYGVAGGALIAGVILIRGDEAFR